MATERGSVDERGTMEVMRLSSEKRTRGTNNAPTWSLTRPLNVLASMVSGATIPNTMYTVVAGVSDAIPTDVGVAVIPAGVYTIAGLAAAAQAALQALDPAFTCTYDTLTLKYTISYSGPFSLLWTTAIPGAALALGFTPLPPLAAPSILTVHVGDRAVSGSEPSCVLLRCNELAGGSAPSFGPAARSDTAIARIALTGALGVGGSNYDAVMPLDRLSYGTGIVLTELTVTIVDAVTDLAVDLNGAPWTLELVLWVNEDKTRVRR